MNISVTSNNLFWKAIFKLWKLLEVIIVLCASSALSWITIFGDSGTAEAF